MCRVIMAESGSLFLWILSFDCMDAGGRATHGAVAEDKQRKVPRLSVREPTPKQPVAIATQKTKNLNKMLKLTETTNTKEAPDDTLTLPYDARQKSRQPAVTQGGIQVGVFLSRGQTLRHGAVLTNGQGFKVRIEAEPEALSTVQCSDPLLFGRACYHLGNRHVPLQILPGELRYLTDHVLDQMLVGLGLSVEHQTMPFEPEAGAYHGH